MTDDNKQFNVAFGSTASRLFTDSSSLRDKVHGYFELEFEPPATWRGSLYRTSSTKPGWLSREFYSKTDAGWVRTGEDVVKYTSPPKAGSHSAQVLTFLVYSKEAISQAMQEELRKVLSIFPT